MTGPLSRFAVAVLILLPVLPEAARAETGAFVDIRPVRALRMSEAALGPEIPGVTYPRRPPPNLVAAPAPEGIKAEPPAPEAVAMAEQPAAAVNAPAAAAAAAPAPATVPVKQEAAEPAPPVATPASTPITLRLDVDLATQRLTVTEHGAVKAVWPISSGRPSTPTKTGTFRPQWASRMWYSRQYDMAPMPHAVFFNGGIAFHATQATHLLGRPASHGCVRLAPQNARALYTLIHAHGYAHTEIVVAGQPQVAASEKRKPKARITGAAPATAFWPFF